MKFPNFFEDPDHPSLGPVLKLLKITLLWAPSRTGMQTVIYQSMISVASLLALSQCVHLTERVTRAPALLNMMQYSVFHIGLMKMFVYRHSHTKWEEIINFISETERNFKRDAACKKHLDKYTRHVRAVVAFCLVSGSAACSNLFSKTWVQVIRASGPGNYTRVLHLSWPLQMDRYVDTAAQTVYGYVTSFYVVMWDCLAISVMVVLAGQLDLVRVRFRHALDCRDPDKQRRNLIDSHKYYIAILKYHDLCNSLMSPVMFVYLLLVSSNLALTILQMISFSKAELLASVPYVSALLSELLLFYWHGNEVTVKSELVSAGVYESEWYNKTVSVQREIALLSHATTKRLVFTAGPFNEMSLATFISILRGTYSFLTFINKTK